MKTTMQCICHSKLSLTVTVRDALQHEYAEMQMSQSTMGLSYESALFRPTQVVQESLITHWVYGIMAGSSCSGIAFPDHNGAYDLSSCTVISSLSPEKFVFEPEHE